MRRLPDFSPAQWEFVAVIEAFGEPVSVDIVAALAPLTSAALLNLVLTCILRGWLHEDDGNRLSISRNAPGEIIDKVRQMNTPALIAILLNRINELDLGSRIEPDMMARLQERSGREFEIAFRQNEYAVQCIQSGDMENAIHNLEQAISFTTRFLGQRECDTLFISSVLELAQIRYRLGKGLGNMPGLLEKAQEVAAQRGDKRSQALLSLHVGRFYHFNNRLYEALEIMGSGLKLVEELGDSDILHRSAEFLGMYYFARGLYKEASRHLERAMHANLSREGGVFDSITPIYLGYSLVSLGYFEQAVGVLYSNWNLAQLRDERALATIIRAALGSELLIMGKRSEAIAHLVAARDEAIEQKNARALYVAQRAIAYDHLLQGNIQESYDLSFENITSAVQENAISSNYAVPWSLEMLFQYQQQGYEPIPDQELDHEIRRFIRGPNIHLRGVAYRIMARIETAKGTDPGVVLSLLETSESDLARSEDPIELARTRVEMASLILRQGQKDRAREIALGARKGLSAYGEHFIPAELRDLLQDKQPLEKPCNDPAVYLERFIEMMEEFVPSIDENELLSRLIASSCKFFGAERGGIFWVNGGRPVLRGTYNLSPSEVESKIFNNNLRLILKTYTNNQPFLLHNRATGGDLKNYQPVVVLCLPFEFKRQVRGVLFHENFYIDTGFDGLDRATLVRIARHFGRYIERILEHSKMLEDKSDMALEHSTARKAPEKKDIIAESLVMEELLTRIDQVACTEAAVLLLGETGVGKEVLAKRIHDMSTHRTGPLVVIDLATAPENLVESDLFGHEKGAFTGADRQKKGRMELAHEGTLFIDEVGDVPPSIQVKLLRALQEKTFVRVGGTRNLSSDFRLVAATNRDLEKEVKEGRFRQDLYYRLNVVPIIVPPLRARDTDIILLAQYFLDHYARKYSRSNLVLKARDKKSIESYPWPGNVRELKNVIERSVILSTDGNLEIALKLKPEQGSIKEILTMEELQRQHIKYVLEKTGGRVGGCDGAAALLGMKRTTLYTRMRKLGLMQIESECPVV